MDVVHTMLVLTGKKQEALELHERDEGLIPSSVVAPEPSEGSIKKLGLGNRCRKQCLGC